MLSGTRADAVWVLLRLKLYQADKAAKLVKGMPLRYARQLAGMKADIQEARHLDDLRLDACEILQAYGDQVRQDLATAET